MDIRDKLQAIGEKKGLEGEHLEAYIRFFSAKFSEKIRSDYPMIWANRFKDGTMMENCSTNNRDALIEAYRSQYDY